MREVKHLPDWCPGTGFKQTARTMAAQLTKCTEQPYAFVKHQMAQKKHKVSFLSQAIESCGSDAEMEFVNKWSALSLYLGGADTVGSLPLHFRDILTTVQTVSSLMTFFLAMTVSPEAQKKGQEEIDRVIGNDRIPVIADRDKLPYIEAMVKEVHRWHPVLPMGLPHSSMSDDVWEGYTLPKGAILLPNTW